MRRLTEEYDLGKSAEKRKGAFCNLFTQDLLLLAGSKTPSELSLNATCDEIGDAGMGLRIRVAVVGAYLIACAFGRKTRENRRHRMDCDASCLKLRLNLLSHFDIIVIVPE